MCAYIYIYIYILPKLKKKYIFLKNINITLISVYRVYIKIKKNIILKKKNFKVYMNSINISCDKFFTFF